MNAHNTVTVDELVSNREKFADFVYTPIEILDKSLEERNLNDRLGLYVEQRLSGVGIPNIISNRKTAFLSRSLTTPNFETQQFLRVVRENTKLEPLFWEYSSDEFRPNVNQGKYFIAKLFFYDGTDRRGNDRVRGINIIDFNCSNSKKLSEVRTLWGQPLIEFHHEFTDKFIPETSRNKDLLFDATPWYKASGGGVESYYKNLLILFLRHGVMFENFIIDDMLEISFIKKIFLPAFIQIYNETGFKPIICMLTKQDNESKKYWMYYKIEYIEFVKEKLNLL